MTDRAIKAEGIAKLTFEMPVVPNSAKVGFEADWWMAATVAIIAAALAVAARVLKRTIENHIEKRWHRAFAWIVAGTLAVILVLVALASEGGLFTTSNATVWAASFAALASIMIFSMGKFTEEMNREEAEEKARNALKRALGAEILSNRRRLARSFDETAIGLKIARIELDLWKKRLDEAAEAERVIEKMEDESFSAKSSHNLSIVDRTQPFFERAIGDHGSIPEGAIAQVVTYYNFDGMLTALHAGMSADTFDKLPADRQYQAMAEYLSLAAETYRASTKALEAMGLTDDVPPLVTEARLDAVKSKSAELLTKAKVALDERRQKLVDRENG